VFDPEIYLSLYELRGRELMRDAEVARALGEGATARQRRVLAATMRRLAERIDPGTGDKPFEGQPI
jgi:hypothetical protein